VTLTEPKSGSPNPEADLDAAKKLIGEHVRALRVSQKVSTRELAAETGLTAAMISQLERGQVAPSLSTLLKLSSALGVGVGDLLGRPQTGEQVIRRQERRIIDYPELAVRDEWLSSDRSGRLLVLKSIVGPGSDSGPELLSHRSEIEFVHVLSGSIEILRSELDPVCLEQGDSLTFVNNGPHGFRNNGSVPAELIWVMTPGSY
jgi:transcriptional regulator with XRE-family HTH domain